MPYDIGPRIGVDGEAKFREQIKSVSTTLKTLDSEMKVVTSSFAGNEKSMESLTAQNQVLGKQVSALTERMDVQKKMLEESTKSYGEADERTQKWQRAVNETEAAINKANSQISENSERLRHNGLTAEEAAKKAEEAHKRHAKAIETVTKALAAMSAAVVGVVGAVGKLTLDAARAADDLNTMAKTTGLSTEELQRYQYAADLVDVSLDTITGSMTKLTKTMATASKGTGDAYDAFAALGVEITNQDGTLRDRNAVFQEAIRALGEIDNETQRDAYAMQIFGRAAQDLNPLILGGADALQQLGDEAESAGLILSQDALDKLNLVSDATDRLKASAKAAGNLFSVGFAEPMAQGIETLTGYIQRLTGAFSRGGMEAVVEELDGVLADLLGTVDDYLPRLAEFGTKAITQLGMGIVKAAPALVDSASTILLTLVRGISSMLPELIPAAVDAALTIAEALVDNVDLLVDAAAALILGLAEGLIKALPRLVEKAPVIIGKLVSSLLAAIPQVVATGVELVVRLAGAIVQSDIKLRETAPKLVYALLQGIAMLFANVIQIGGELVGKIAEGVRGAVDQAKTWGRDLMSNFISGITSKIEELKNGVRKVANTIKSFIGFSEPSQGPLASFHTFSPDMVELFAQGITRNAWRIRDAMEDAVAGLATVATAAPLPEVGIATAAGYGTAPGGWDPSALAAAIAQGLHGCGVYMDRTRVGRIVTTYQSNAARAGAV